MPVYCDIYVLVAVRCSDTTKNATIIQILSGRVYRIFYHLMQGGRHSSRLQWTFGICPGRSRRTMTNPRHRVQPLTQTPQRHVYLKPINASSGGNL